MTRPIYERDATWWKVWYRNKDFQFQLTIPPSPGGEGWRLVSVVVIPDPENEGSSDAIGYWERESLLQPAVTEEPAEGETEPAATTVARKMAPLAPQAR